MGATKKELDVQARKLQAIRDAIANPRDECIVWIDSDRYYETRYAGSRIGLHILAYQLAYGPVPEGLFVCHSCDNPPCFNPRHLVAGSQQFNIASCAQRGRHRGVPPVRKGSENGASKLTEAQVREIRRLYVKGAPGGSKLLGKRYGISGTMVLFIVTGHKWAHVT